MSRTLSSTSVLPDSCGRTPGAPRWGASRRASALRCWQSYRDPVDNQHQIRRRAIHHTAVAVRVLISTLACVRAQGGERSQQSAKDCEHNGGGRSTPYHQPTTTLTYVWHGADCHRFVSSFATTRTHVLYVVLTVGGWRCRWRRRRWRLRRPPGKVYSV
jgi:hypothetical protein